MPCAWFYATGSYTRYFVGTLFNTFITHAIDGKSVGLFAHRNESFAFFFLLPFVRDDRNLSVHRAVACSYTQIDTFPVSLSSLSVLQKGVRCEPVFTCTHERRYHKLRLSVAIANKIFTSVPSQPFVSSADSLFGLHHRYVHPTQHQRHEQQDEKINMLLQTWIMNITIIITTLRAPFCFYRKCNMHTI